MTTIEQVMHYAQQENLVSGNDEFNERVLEKALESIGFSLSATDQLKESDLRLIHNEVLENPDVYKLYKLDPKRQLILKKKSNRNRRFI